jgi:hypothetical protein
MGDIQVTISFTDLSEEQYWKTGMPFDLYVWIDVDANIATGQSAGAFQGSDVELYFTTLRIDDYGQYEDPGTLAEFVSLTHWDAWIYTWDGAIFTNEAFEVNVLVDGYKFIFGSFAHWEPYANLVSNFIVRAEVVTFGSDQTDTPLIGNGTVTDPEGDAGEFADIVAVTALFNVP